MKNYFLWWLLALWVFVPLFAKSISPDAWVLWSPIQQSNWISNTAWGCTAVLDRASCDYTWPSVALRLWYEYEFADEFWAWDQDRRFKNHCARFQEQWNYNTGDGRNWLNPGFDRTEQLKNNGYRINKNTSMVILRANSIYQINAVPSTRTPGNLYIKYVVEYANDEAANTRYQHTECYPYEISRCGDGKVDTDWFKKSPNDPAEECDEWANNGKSGSSCTIDCKKVEVKDPKCSSEYNAQTKYTETSAEWLKRTDKLCEEWNVDTFKSTRNEWQPRSFEWDCKNSEGKKTSYVCNAKQEWCGDGVYNKDHEQCDPKDSKHTNYEDGTHKTCNEKCELIDDDATCSSQYNGKNVYTSSSTHYLNWTASENLCNVWSLKQGTFWFNFVPWFPIYFQWNPYGPLQYKWLCENWQKISSNCTLNQYRCGDGHTNADKNPLSFIDGKAHYEACDPKDPNSDWKCNNDCTYAMAECGPANSTTAVYNSNYPTSRIKENELCKTWKLKEWSFSWPDSNGNYKWECKNGAKEVSCGAKDLRCGDNKYQKDYEQCDPTDPNRTNWEEWTWKTCNSNCTLTGIVRNKPVCNSYFSGVNKYTEFDSTPWVKESDYLCTQWTKDGYTYNWEWNKRVFKWTCSKDGYTVDCSASQTWCGDWIQNNGEKCDPEDGSHEWWWDGWCSPKCEPMYGPAKCGSKYNGKKEYLDINLSWLNKSTPWLCDAWTVTGFHKHMDSPIYTWQCENHWKVSNECQADQERCGDGIVQKDNEACDPENPEWKNRTDGTWCSAACEKEWCGDGIVQTYLWEECDWTKGCSSQCKLVNPPTWCNEYFTRGLRLWETKVFTDVLYAEWHDRYLYHQDVKFTENHGDYNNGVNPSFNWTDQLIKAWMKVDANSEMPIIESTPYHLITPPTVRSPNNLYVEYTIWYDNVRHEYIPSQDNLYSHKECFKYEISRCGDGVIDTGYNEVCDPGSEETKKAPDWQICNDKCEFEKVPAPVCNSKYNGQTVENLTEGPDLCSVWNYTTGSFNFNPQTNTWTWKCDNVAWVGKECSATKKVTPKWKPEIEKTLKNKVIVNAVNQKLTWTVKVTAKWWDIKDFKVRDKLPKVLKYDTFRVVKNQDNLKVSSKPSGPVESWSNNIYTWNVTWTLHEWHELILEIDSVVVKMPTKKDDYLNVACVEDDNKIDCDDAKPWTAEILKELQNKREVTETGQELDWKVTVIASWWDIENFEIWDKLPIELDYAGWELDKANTQDKVTVTHDDKRSPKLSWDVNIHYWNVDWILYSGNKITMIVKSTVKRMPTSWEDILNVACVVQSGNEIDCAEDNPPKPGWKLVIQKTLNPKKLVTETWEILTWDIKVTASWWAVTWWFKISDIVPYALEFTWVYKIKDNPAKLTMWKWHKWDISDLKTWKWWEFTGEVWTLDVNGGLKQNQSLVLTVTTRVVKMPKTEDDYRNVACVIKDDTQECDDDKPKQKPDLRIKKHFTDWTKSGKNVKIWDEIAYRIDFGNSWNTVASITSIKDFLPKNVKYISSKIFVEGTNSYTGSTQSWDDTIFKWFTAKEGIHIDIYGWINLQPGQTWYIILTWEVLRDFTGQRTNFACIYLNDEVIDCDDATHKIEPNEFKCEKLEVPTWDLSNWWWSKEVKCTASGGVADLITIDCWEWASWNRYITWDNKSELNGTCTYPSWANAYSLKCTVKKDGKDYTSNGCNWSVTVKWSTWPSWCFPAWTKVTMADWTKKNIEDVKVWDRVLSYNTDTNKNEWNLVLNRLVHEDNVHEMYELTINGKVLKVTDVHRFYVRKSDSSKDYDWIESKHLKVGDILLMNDGSLVKIEKINHYSNVETVYNLTVENNHNYFVDKWYLVHNSKHPWWCTSNCNPTPYCEENPDRLECNIANENCFNINVWNFSIEKTELLPLYLNVYRKNDGYNYVFKNSNDGCSPEDINLASFKCKIRILRPDDNEIAYTSNEFDCLTLGENVFTSNDNPLIKKRAGKQTDLYTIDPFDGGAWKYRPTIMVISWNKLNTKNNNWEDILWEYKFQIMVTKYDQCAVDDDWNGNWWKTITREDAPVCQNNFVLTDSYTVQKTPSWNLTASTDTLEKFKEADGDKVSFASYLKAIATSEYHPNDTVNKAMDTFIDKYKRLAVKVDISKSKFLSSQVEVKKVPGKHIYFVNGDITVKWWSNTIDTPFTIVQTSGKTIINGNVGHNMMLLTKWNIIFSWDCETNQNVKWIFYAQGDLFRDWVKKNDNLRNNVRCTQWWLNIKWVLIWKNFNNLMKDSRSHLETRFVEWNKTTKVMNWWSVVIEYSPSIFTKGTMPPGAEDFTTALSIYKN